MRAPLSATGSSEGHEKTEKPRSGRQTGEPVRAVSALILMEMEERQRVTTGRQPYAPTLERARPSRRESQAGLDSRLSKLALEKLSNGFQRSRCIRPPGNHAHLASMRALQAEDIQDILRIHAGCILDEPDFRFKRGRHLDDLSRNPGVKTQSVRNRKLLLQGRIV